MYFDNNIADVGLFGEKVMDESASYREHKDLNDLLRGIK